MLKTFTIRTLLLIAIMPLLSCTGTRPSNLGITNIGLAPCPASPNCVSSDERDHNHNISPFQLKVSPPEAWQTAREVVSELPRTTIINETEEYLHAECQSAVMGFVDDLELHLRPSEGVIAIRSASRLGYSDFGVNRRRVEDLRDSLISRGVVQASHSDKINP